MMKVTLIAVSLLILVCVTSAYQVQRQVITFKLEDGDPHFIEYGGHLVDKGEYWYLNFNTGTSYITFKVLEKEDCDAVLVFTYSKDDPNSVGQDTFELLASDGGPYKSIWSAPTWGPVVNKTEHVYVPAGYKYFKFSLSDGRNSYEYLILNKTMQVILFANQTPTTTTTTTTTIPVPTPPSFFDTIMSNINPQDVFMILTLIATIVASYIAYKIIKRGSKRRRGRGIKFEKYG